MWRSARLQTSLVILQNPPAFWRHVGDGPLDDSDTSLTPFVMATTPNLRLATTRFGRTHECCASPTSSCVEARSRRSGDHEARSAHRSVQATAGSRRTSVRTRRRMAATRTVRGTRRASRAPRRIRTRLGAMAEFIDHNRAERDVADFRRLPRANRAGRLWRSSDMQMFVSAR